MSSARSSRLRPRSDDAGRVTYRQDQLVSGLSFTGAGVLLFWCGMQIVLGKAGPGGEGEPLASPAVLFGAGLAVLGLVLLLGGLAMLLARRRLTFDPSVRRMTYRLRRLRGETVREVGYDSVRAEVRPAPAGKGVRSRAEFVLVCSWPDDRMTLHRDEDREAVRRSAQEFERLTGLTCQEHPDREEAVDASPVG